MEQCVFNNEESMFKQKLQYIAKKIIKGQDDFMKYDYLVVGAGLFGATFANLAYKNGKKVLVIDRRNHIAGNVYTENIEGINVHKYGAHIFHTDYKDVWDYVNSFVEFNRYTNSPIARIGNEVYNLPFNMNTFSKMWNDVFTDTGQNGE